MPEDPGALFLSGFFKSQELKQNRQQFTQDLAFKQASLAQQAQLAGNQLEFEKLQNTRIAQHEDAILKFQQAQEARIGAAQQFAEHFQTEGRNAELSMNPSLAPATTEETGFLQNSFSSGGKNYRVRSPQELTQMHIASENAEDQFKRLQSQRTLQELPGMIGEFYTQSGVPVDPELSTKLAVSHILPTAIPALFAQDKNGTIESGFHEMMAPGLAHFTENARKDPNYINTPPGQAFMKLYMSGAEAIKAAGAMGTVRGNEAVKAGDRERYDYTNQVVNELGSKLNLQRSDPNFITKVQAIELAAQRRAQREGKQLDPKALEDFRSKLNMSPGSVNPMAGFLTHQSTQAEQEEIQKSLQFLEAPSK